LRSLLHRFAPIALAILVLLLSFLQVQAVGRRDLRVRAMLAVVDERTVKSNDPGPSVMVARALAIEPRVRIYDPTRTEGSAFIYPPIAAAIYAPIAQGTPTEIRHALFVGNRLLLAAIVICALAIARGGKILRPLELVGGAAALTVFYPLLRAVELNQATVFVTFLFAIAWLGTQRGWHAVTGSALAAAIAVKPQLVLMLPLLVFHSRRLVAWALGAGATLLVLSLVYAGVANHVDYVTKILPTLSNGYAYYPNHSWNGFWNRLLLDVPIDHFAVAPSDAGVTWLTLIASASTYGAALWLTWRWRHSDRLAMMRLGFAWLVTTIISPIAWEHHYAPAIFVFAACCAAIRTGQWTPSPRVVTILAGSFALLAAYFEVRQLQGPATLLVSYVFYGALALAATLGYAINSQLRAATIRREQPDLR
jgi:hypothetical protein